MKIRFINTNEPVTTYYRDLVPMLVDAGHEVELLVSRAEYRGGRGFDKTFEGMKNVTVKHTFAGPFKNYNSFVSKGFVHLFYSLHGFIHMLIGPKADINIFLTQPPFFYFMGPVIQRIRRSSYFVVVMDLQPDEYVEFGHLKRGSWYTRLLNRITVSAFKKAKGVIVIGRCMGDVIAGKGVPRENIHFIPNWTTETAILPVDNEDNQLRVARTWQDKFVISYGGNIGNAQNFDDFVSLSEEFSEYDDIVFALIGGGMKFTAIQKLKEERGIKNLEMLPFMHKEHGLSTIYGAGDVNFISLRHECTGLGVPSKAYVSLAAGRPILFQGSPDCEIARMVDEEGIGCAVKDREGLKAAILELYGNAELRMVMGKKARELSDGIYSTKKSCQKYVDLLSRGE